MSPGIIQKIDSQRNFHFQGEAFEKKSEEFLPTAIII